MLHTVKQVVYVEKYKLKLSFNDGKVKIIDFEEKLREAKNMFLPLKKIEYFKKVKTDGTTLVWPNGLDLCPDSLYTQGVDVKASKKKNSVPKKVKSSSTSQRANLRIAAKSKY